MHACVQIIPSKPLSAQTNTELSILKLHIHIHT